MTWAELQARVAIPVIAAPMFLVSGVELTVAVSLAGGIGSFPAPNARTPESLADWLTQIERRLRDPSSGLVRPFAVNVPLRHARTAEYLDVCERYRVPIVITSVGAPAEAAARVHGWGGLVLHDVTTMRFAEKAIAAGVDAIILICAGAGGHAGTASPFAFAAQVRERFDTPFIVAGGIVDGAGIAAARAMGAALAYMGTRFIATHEALSSQPYREMLVEAEMADVLYTDAISGLPASFLAQSIRAAGLDPHHLPPPLGPLRPDLPAGLRAWKHIWSAGHGVGAVRTIEDTAVVMARLAREYDVARAALQE